MELVKAVDDEREQLLLHQGYRPRPQVLQKRLEARGGLSVEDVQADTYNGNARLVNRRIRWDVIFS